MFPSGTYKKVVFRFPRYNDTKRYKSELCDPLELWSPWAFALAHFEVSKMPKCPRNWNLANPGPHWIGKFPMTQKRCNLALTTRALCAKTLILERMGKIWYTLIWYTRVTIRRTGFCTTTWHPYWTNTFSKRSADPAAQATFRCSSFLVEPMLSKEHPISWASQFCETHHLQQNVWRNVWQPEFSLSFLGDTALIRKPSGDPKPRPS